MVAGAQRAKSGPSNTWSERRESSQIGIRLAPTMTIGAVAARGAELYRRSLQRQLEALLHRAVPIVVIRLAQGSLHSTGRCAFAIG